MKLGFIFLLISSIVDAKGYKWNGDSSIDATLYFTELNGNGNVPGLTRGDRHQLVSPRSSKQCTNWKNNETAVPLLFSSAVDDAPESPCLDVLFSDELTGNTDGETAVHIDLSAVKPFPYSKRPGNKNYGPSKVHVVLANSANLPDTTLRLHLKQPTAGTGEGFIGIINGVDDEGAITSVKVLRSNTATKPYPRLDTTVEVWREKQGQTAAEDTVGSGAKFRINWKLTDDDKNGMVDSIDILNGGKGYTATQEAFIPSMIMAGLKKKNSAGNDEVNMNTFTNVEADGCVDIKDDSLPCTDTTKAKCTCYWHSVTMSYDFSTTYTSCLSDVLHFKDQYLTKFSVYTFLQSLTDGSYGQALVQDVPIDVHGYRGMPSVAYPMVNKWDDQRANIREDVTVTMEFMDEGNWYLVDPKFSEAPFSGIADPKKAIGDVEYDFRYLNKRAQVVSKPFVLNMAPSASIAGVDEDTIPDTEWTTKPTCTVERRPDANKGKFIGISVLFGGEGCSSDLEYSVRPDSSSEWKSAALTVNDGVVTKATLDGTDDWAVKGHTWEGKVIDTFTVDSVRMMKFGSGYDKDSLPTITFTPNSDITTETAAEFEAEVSDNGELTGVKVKTAGKYKGKYEDLWDMSKKATFTIAASGTSGEIQAEAYPLLVPSCDLNPQFDLQYEWDGLLLDTTTYASDLTAALDEAKCEFEFEEVGCADIVGTETKYKISNVLITYPGRYYYAHAVDDAQNYPRIKASASGEDDKYIGLDTTASEFAEFDLTMDKGIVSASVTKPGKGYNQLSPSTWKIEMPKLTQSTLHHRASGGSGGNAQGLIGGVVVLEGGSGYQDWHKLCCSPDRSRTYAYNPSNGVPIGELTLDENGSVTAVEVSAGAWKTCGVDRMADNDNSAKHGQFFVCGKKLKSVTHKRADPQSCKEWGNYDKDNLPFLSVNFGDTPTKGTDNYRDSHQFTPPKVTPSFTEGTGGDSTYLYISEFAVTDGGWFHEISDTITVSVKAAGKDRLTSKDSTSGKDLTVTDLQFEYETAGEGCVLAASDSAWLLREMNGKEFDAPTGKGDKLNLDTTFTIENGGVSGVSLARSGTHSFSGMAPLTVKIYDATANSYKDLTKINEHDLNADGTIPDDFQITFDPYSDYHGGMSGKYNGVGWDGDTGTEFKREKKDNVFVQAEAPARGRRVEIHSATGIVWGGSLRYESHSSTMGLRIESFGVVKSPVSNFNAADDHLSLNRRTTLTVVNNTYTWHHHRVATSDKELNFEFIPHVTSPYYPISGSFQNVTGKPFAAQSDLFSVVTGAKVSWSVKEFKDITDKSVELNVTRNQFEHEQPRFRVCPDKHDYWDRVDFEVEVLNGTGKAKVFYGVSTGETLTTSYDKNENYPALGSNWWFTEGQYATGKRRCIDVRVEFDESYCNVDKSWERPVVDHTIQVRLTSKVTYYGGECTVDEQCVIRNFQGGATKASLAVRASANSNPDRFTMCTKLVDPNNPVCLECSADCDCGAGQYCFIADTIIDNYKKGQYAQGAELAWAEAMLAKHMTCQKKQGLLEPCGSFSGSRNDFNDDNYRFKHVENGDHQWCGENLWDYNDETKLSELWSGKCINHVCVECHMHEDHASCPKYRTCLGGLWKDSHTLDASRNNDFIANSAKLQTDNEVAQAKAATRIDMLTDIMGATLMFVMISTVATVVSTLLLAGRCGSCRNTGDNKVTPQ